VVERPLSAVGFAVGAQTVHGSSYEEQTRQPEEEDTSNCGRHAMRVWSAEVTVDHQHCAGNRLTPSSSDLILFCLFVRLFVYLLLY